MDKSKFYKGLLPLLGAVAFWVAGNAEKIVILHTNDTHSSIDVLPDGTSGILQRKAILDSVRNAEKNVITVDAGDAVQGSLYFKYFNGDVEYPLMNLSGYDIRVLGNHEFDNGMESLAHYYKQIEGEPLSANYDFSGTELEGVFKPYTIKQFDGKKIGFIGINIDPNSIIAAKNITAKFKDIIPTANELASFLKNEENVDMVIVVSHIGYDKINNKTSDIELAENSKDIDIIIGGHTHTLIDPLAPEINSSLIKNLEGKNVRVVQAGKQGKFIGELTIDLENLPIQDGSEVSYSLIPVTDRFPEETLDKNMKSYLQPYREAVDSVNNLVIAYCATDLPQARIGGLPNLTADIGFEYGKEITDSLKNAGIDIQDLDMSIMNVGGIRFDMPAGKITEGQILSTYPFTNLFEIIRIKGEDLIEALRISALKGGEAISSNVRVITDTIGQLKRVIINGKEMDPAQDYLVATIDYLAEGNDDLVSLANHENIWVSEEELARPILRWIKRQHELGLKVDPDPRSRFVIEDIQEENAESL